MDDTKAGTVSNLLEGCASIQRDLNRMEQQADRNLMQFNKVKSRVLQLGTTPGGATNCYAERGLGVLVGIKLNISQRASAAKANGILDCTRRSVDSRSRSDSSTLLSTEEATPRVLCPLL